VSEASDKPVFLVDVDGVVADLMGGFKLWLEERGMHGLEREKISKFHIPKSPELQAMHAAYDLDLQLDRFLGQPDIYQTHVSPIPGAKAALKVLAECCEIVFVTATLKKAPESYVSKFNWCRDTFGDIPMIACPSHHKFLVQGTWAVDDRYDTCQRYGKMRTIPFLFDQPWNEAPATERRHNWMTIVDEITRDLSGV
jgi:5'(3')-deoxyribonucleotidase